ncbi:MAG: peptide chain release factor-like protein [Verrucomicrobiota bacterium]
MRPIITVTAVVLVHVPTGIAAEASERRSQHENRGVALKRLRLRLLRRIAP